MGLAEDRAKLMAANDRLGEAIATVTATINSLEDATGMIAGTIEGFDNIELTEALGMVAQASGMASDVQRMAAEAQTRLESYIARMS